MPIYEYQCEACHHCFDKFVRSMLTEIEVTCPACGSSQVRKGFSTFASRGSNGGRAAMGASASDCAPSG
jgi:putative FmdB family regulatory protein